MNGVMRLFIIERELGMKFPRVVLDKQDNFCHNLHFQCCKFGNWTLNSNLSNTVPENIMQKSPTEILSIMRE